MIARARGRERGTGSVYPRGGVWWIKYYKDGGPVRESSGSTSKTRANRLLQMRLRAVSSGEPFRLGMEKIKVAELAQDFLQDYRINGLKSLPRKGFLTIEGYARLADACASVGLWLRTMLEWDTHLVGACPKSRI